ncbi:hypothetical protein J6590_077647 [Homalodisca vitripennis]|nr:hypothetical protein J6590_077647 [Homalodisca vitripennis]
MYVMWRSVVWLWRRRSSRRHVVTKGNKEPGGVGERPLAIPLATLHGKELRITIEENCAAEVTDTFSTGGPRQTRPWVGDLKGAEQGMRQDVYC